MKKIIIIGIALLSMAFYCNVYADTTFTWEHDGTDVDGNPVTLDGFIIIYYKANDVPADKTDWTDPKLGWFKVPDGAARTLGVSDNTFEVGETYVFEGAAYLIDGGLSDWMTGDQTQWDGGSFVTLTFTPPSGESQVITVGPGKPDPVMDYTVGQ